MSGPVIMKKMTDRSTLLVHNRRAQMGFLPQIVPFGIYKISRNVVSEMVEAYGEAWTEDPLLKEMAYRIVGLELRRSGIWVTMLKDARRAGSCQLEVGCWKITLSAARAHLQSQPENARGRSHMKIVACDDDEIKRWAAAQAIRPDAPVFHAHSANARLWTFSRRTSHS